MAGVAQSFGAVDKIVELDQLACYFKKLFVRMSKGDFMKLYFSKGACSLTVRIVLHELKLDAEYEAVDLKTKKTVSGEDFYKINHKGTVPVLVTKENEILTENIAILEYLGDVPAGRQLLPLIGDFNRYRVLEWLSFISSDLHKNFGPLFNPNVPESVKNEIFIPILQKKFEFIEKSLTDKYFLTGDEFTLPDAYLFVVLRWAHHLKLEAISGANLAAYFKRVRARQAVQLALQEEGLV